MDEKVKDKIRTLFKKLNSDHFVFRGSNLHDFRKVILACRMGIPYFATGIFLDIPDTNTYLEFVIDEFIKFLTNEENPGIPDCINLVGLFLETDNTKSKALLRGLIDSTYFHYTHTYDSEQRAPSKDKTELVELEQRLNSLKKVQVEIDTKGSIVFIRERKKGMELIAILVGFLSHRVDYLKKSVMRSLAKIGSVASEAIPDLIVITKHSNIELRKLALKTLGAMKQKSPEVLDALNESLKDDDNFVVNEGKRVLKKLGFS